MEFLKKHYEKIILAAFLLVFIISLILLIVALNKSRDIKEEDLKFPVKQPDYKKINPEDINYRKVLEAEMRWLPNTPRTEGDNNFSDLIIPYKVARCPNPECQKLIPRSYFVENGSCPLCKSALHDPISTSGVGPNADSDEDGIPDKDEKLLGLNPNDPSDAQRDNDNDGFTNLEEYKAKTDINDPKSHPPLAKRLYVDSIKRGFLPTVLIKVTAHGDDMKTWTIQMDETVAGGAVKTRFYKLGAILTLNERKYEIKGIQSEVVEEKVDKRGTSFIKKTVYSITLQEEGDTPITAVEKKLVPENKESVKIIDKFNEKEYFVAVKESLTVGDTKTGEEKYTVKSVNNAKKKVILLRDSDNAEYEIGPSDGDVRQEGILPAANTQIPAPGEMPKMPPEMQKMPKMPPGMPKMPPGMPKMPPGAMLPPGAELKN